MIECNILLDITEQYYNRTSWYINIKDWVMGGGGSTSPPRILHWIIEYRMCNRNKKENTPGTPPLHILLGKCTTHPPDISYLVLYSIIIYTKISS